MVIPPNNNPPQSEETNEVNTDYIGDKTAPEVTDNQNNNESHDNQNVGE